MSVKLICDRDDMPHRYTRVKRIEMEIDDDADIGEMLDVYRDFLRAMGYEFDGTFELSPNIYD